MATSRMQVPGPDWEEQTDALSDVSAREEESFSTDADMQRVTAEARASNIRRIAAAFNDVTVQAVGLARLVSFLLALLLICFVFLHIYVAAHYVIPDLVLDDDGLSNLKSLLAMIWSKIGGWVLPIIVVFANLLSNWRERQ